MLLGLCSDKQQQAALNSSDLQFGFKPNVSNNQCTFALNETILYYNSRKTNVYVALLDATKAFDRVNYCKLFRKLIEKNMSPLVLKLLLYMYTYQKLQVNWSDHIGNMFSVSNGVKQDSVLSPILFTIYFVGCLAYADDHTLIAPSRKALQTMISICEGYAADYDVIFNGPKSQFLIFKGKGCQATDCQIVVNNERLNTITSAVHLEHCISTLNKNSLIDAAGAQFWKSFNIFSADFGHIYPFLQCRLFTKYCCSFYGAPLWNFVHYNKICTAWRKALRKMWSVSPMTHGNIITLLSEIKPLELSLMQ